MLLSILASKFFWLGLSHFGVLIVGVFFGWNNPRKKVETLLDGEITKAAHAGQADILNILTVIKSKL